MGIVDLNLNIILSFGLKLQNAVVTQMLTLNSMCKYDKPINCMLRFSAFLKSFIPLELKVFK